MQSAGVLRTLKGPNYPPGWSDPYGSIQPGSEFSLFNVLKAGINYGHRSKSIFPEKYHFKYFLEKTAGFRTLIEQNSPPGWSDPYMPPLTIQ